MPPGERIRGPVAPGGWEASGRRDVSAFLPTKGYSAHDGAGISLARIAGLKCGVITKRISETVAARMRDLKMDYVYQGQAFKMKPIREIMDKEGATLDEIAYVGDDVVDLPVMRRVGLAVAVANAREQVKAEAHYVTPQCRRIRRRPRCLVVSSWRRKES